MTVTQFSFGNTSICIKSLDSCPSTLDNNTFKLDDGKVFTYENGAWFEEVVLADVIREASEDRDTSVPTYYLLSDMEVHDDI